MLDDVLSTDLNAGGEGRLDETPALLGDDADTDIWDCIREKMPGRNVPRTTRAW